MKFLYVLYDLLRFLWGSTNQHGIHSPYLYRLYEHVIEDDRTFYDFEKLEAIRASYLQNKNSLAIVDLGAGSKFNNKTEKRICDIARQQLSRPYQLRVIYRLIEWVGAQNVLEMGSSLGLSTFYLASATKKVTSLEGNPHFVQFIEFQKKHLGIQNINMVQGDFDDTLKNVLKTSSFDLAFIDGNHRGNALKSYCKQIIPHLTDKGILILDDIHWSNDMLEAWQEIKTWPEIKSSMDLYMMGILFFSPDFIEKKHLKIRPKKWW